ncbi:MAG: UvrD-helicase domain-containing protein [Planctomycetota bacterium]
MARKRATKKDGDDEAVDIFTVTESVASVHAPVESKSPALEGPDPFRLTPDQKAALDLTRNRVISASAGTGKTHTLTALYLGLLEGRLAPGGKLLDENEWLAQARAGTLTPMRPGEIVAVTFTEKAAAELLERTRAALERELSRDLPEALKAHLSVCRRDLFGAPVSTIHAFCARLLREAGADGPVPAAFEVLEADEALELFNDALSSTAAEMLDSGQFRNLEKLAHEAGVFTHRSGLLEMGRSLADALRTRGLPSSVLRSQNCTTLEQIHTWLRVFYDAIAQVPDKGRSKPKPELRAACAERVLPDSLDTARLLALKISPLITGKWFEDSEIDNPFARILSACHVPFTEALAEFVERAQTRYVELKRKAGGVDFDDLMLACKRLLEDEKGRSTAPQRGYRFVLIDEYQDTNPLQRDILMSIAFPDGQTSGAARLGVVGDIKQSIYGFRGADVTLMEDMCRAYEPSPLRENFRSRKNVIDYFNGLFGHIWPASGGRFTYDDLHRLDAAGDALRHAWDGPAGEVITWTKEETGNAARHRQNQAFAIARRIRTLVAPVEITELIQPVIWDKNAKAARTTVRYGDIAILARSLKHLRVPLQIALSFMRVPFRMLKGVSFFTRPEIIDVTNLWAVACDSNDSFSIAGLLRSPFVGMSDAGFWIVSGDESSSEATVTRDLKLPLSEKILKAVGDTDLVVRLSVEDAAALVRASTLLKTMTAWRGRRTAVEILDWALTETGFLSVQAMQPHGEVAVAAVRKAIELARRFETRGNTHLADFVRWLRERADAEWDDPGGSGGQDFSADLPTEEDAVQIGTIHSAKGLEFPIVFFADAGAASPPNNAWALFSPEHGLGLRLGAEFDGLNSSADSLHKANVEKTKSDENAERLRLLYVALTRARDYLIVVGEAGHGETNWRKLIDAYRAVNAAALAEVPAKHSELKAASAGAVSGLLDFEKGVASVRMDLVRGDGVSVPAPTVTPVDIVPAREIRVSVSRLSLWLWCPRRAAFSAWESEPGATPISPAQPEVPTLDGEDALSGEALQARESEVESSVDARVFGTAVHAALDTIFGSDDPISENTLNVATERFTRELLRENAPDDPEWKTNRDLVLALVRSDWGKRMVALPVEDRHVETPFRWRLSTASDVSHVTLIGQLDLIVKTGAHTWQVVDYKLASTHGKSAESESITRYAWQAGLYARVAAEILQTPCQNVEATLAFLRDESVEPRSIEALGHGRISDVTLTNVVNQYACVSNETEPLKLPAQVWNPAENIPKARTKTLCESQHCPYVGRCYSHS